MIYFKTSTGRMSSSRQMEKDDPDNSIIPKLSVLLAGVASAAAVVTVYHCLAVSFRNRRRQRSELERLQQLMYQGGGDGTPASSVENSMAGLLMIPAHKYQKGREGGDCAVCLSELEEGEEVRTLPECSHSFHVDCIDMWLYSHTNCPLCRSNATPSPLFPDYSITSSSSIPPLPHDLVLHSPTQS